MSRFAPDKRRVIRDGFAEELILILTQAFDHIREMDLEEEQRRELHAAYSQVGLLNGRLKDLEAQIEQVTKVGHRSQAGDLLREAMSVRQELLLWMNRGFARIVKIFLPQLYSTNQ